MLYIIFISIVILTKVQENESKVPRKKNEVQRVENLKDKTNREQLVRVVEYLNGEDEMTYEQRKHYDQEKYDTEDVMKLLQKNYDARTDQRNNIPAIRVHIIRNPAVLKKYLRMLRKKQSSSSSDSDTSSSSDADLDRVIERDVVRRNSELRTQKDKRNENNDDSNIKVYSNSNIDVRLSSKNKKPQEGVEASFNSHDYKKSDSYKVEQDADNGMKHNTKKRANDNDSVDDAWDLDGEKKWKKGSEAKKHKRDWGEYIKENDNIAKSTALVEDEKVIKKSKDKKRSRSWSERDSDDWLESKKEKKDRDDNWDEPKTNKKEVNWVGSHLQKEKRDWNDDRWRKITRNEWIESERTTKKSYSKKRKTVRFNTPSFIASIPQYKPFGRERSESGFRGRTPIPFVGKKGIYDDN